jgi:hypothetical protein
VREGWEGREVVIEEHAGPLDLYQQIYLEVAKISLAIFISNPAHFGQS